jgi:AcrR family transcriptional regulator
MDISIIHLKIYLGCACYAGRDYCDVFMSARCFSDTVMPSSGKKKDTRQKLLDSAAILFTEKGYAKSSVAEICKRAGANIAAVNYHFHTKEALYRCVLQYTFDQAESRYPLHIEDEGTVEDRLYQVVLSLLKRILCRDMKGNFYKLVTKEMAEPTPESGTLINEIISRQRGRLQKLIREIYGKAASDELIFRMTHSIVSQCLFLGMHEKGRLHHLKRMPLELKDAGDFARHITDFSLAGIKHYGV